MQKNCKQCSQPFEVTPQDLEFLDKISPIFNGVKIPIPAPTLCPECRQIRRMSFRNERKLYRRKCDVTSKDIFSIFPPNSPFKVCDKDYWYSDQFDPMAYGRPYDFTKSFFEQFFEFEKTIPLPSLRVEKSENSDFNNDIGDCSNCFLCSRTHSCQNCLYTYRGNHSNDCVDCMQVVDSQVLYECVECVNCSYCNYCSFCNNCSSSSFLYDCRGCSNCFLCTNLRNKEYYFMNKPLTKEEYIQKVVQFDSGSYEMTLKGLQFFNDFKKNAIYKNLTIMNSENCTGDNIVDCKNCHMCFGLKFSEDSRYLWDVMRYKNSMDSYSGGRDSELIYETTAVAGGSYNVNFCVRVTESSNISYSYFVRSSKNCFGCIGLSHKEFCILNKQYTEAEYNELMPKILEQMTQNGEYGEFFSTPISLWAYNDTIANDYFPLTKEQAISRGYSWQDTDPKEYLTQTYTIPNNVIDINDSVLKEILACECTTCQSHAGNKCGKNFKINPLELAFYLKQKLPLPHKCPDCRYMTRQMMKNPMKLRKGICSKCKKEIETTYPENLGLKIYCEECYQGEVY